MPSHDESLYKPVQAPVNFASALRAHARWMPRVFGLHLVTDIRCRLVGVLEQHLYGVKQASP